MAVKSWWGWRKQLEQSLANRPGFWQSPLSAYAEQKREKTCANGLFCKQHGIVLVGCGTGSKKYMSRPQSISIQNPERFSQTPKSSTQQEKSQGHGWEEKHEILATAVEFCNMVCNYRLWYFTGYFAGHWNAAEFSAKSLSSSMSILSQEEFFTRWAGFKARVLCLETRCSAKQTINMTSPPTRGFAPISE